MSPRPASPGRRPGAGPERRLVLLRHGRTAWNAEARGQGHADVELDEVGRAQAAAVAPYVAALGPSLLWSSDLARARETAAYVAEATGLEPHHDERLREFSLGRRTGMTMAEYAEAHPEEYAGFRAGRMGVAPDGETTEQVTKRMLAALGDVMATVARGETALVVSHGGALKATVLALLGWPEDLWPGLHGLDNCGWAVLDDTGDDGRMRLLAWNRTAPVDPDFTSPEGVG